MQGVLVERPGDPHVPARQAVLRRQTWYPSPGPPVEAPADDLPAVFALLAADLAGRGFAAAALDRLLTNDELVTLAGLFGVLQQHADERLLDHVEDRVILNLRADEAETDDRTWRLLFAENYVMLHTELAGRPLHTQVRHLLFQCVAPTDRDSGGQTVLVPMAGVVHRLSGRETAVLSATRHAGFDDPPPFLSEFEGRVVVTFKDAEGEPLPWRYDGDDPTVTPDEVEDALRSLLAAMYDPAIAFGIPWERNLLGAFDNTRFLHGRTFSRRPKDRPARHLREVRVFAG
ncbi:MAG TPA: TauD/TfdA family dioxygenase [Acidimicrobiales bacterium]|nr:TauD/TfdA family dioxygenase [Acidimicrobiales bacterium]